MSSPGTGKAQRISGFLVCAVAVAPVLAFVIWLRSSIRIALVVSSAVLLLVSFLRSRKVSEEESTRRQDRAMGKAKDDPNEMARWVP
jgi:Flp pilus assembly protein TadB